MALYDINEFLTLNDVAEYLTDKCNYDFDLKFSIDQNKLIETIIQLVRNYKLHPVFYYSGNVDWLEQKVITSKSDSLINHERVLTGITYDINSRGYYFVSDKNFDKLIENNCSNYINVINCTIEPYHVKGKQEICENNILYYRKIKEDFSIIFHDLLYPKSDLAKLFNQTEANTDTEVIEKLREKVADLEYKLAQAELVETPTHNQKAEKQGDSLLILGAVMHCIKDAAKKNFTQDLLTQTILDRYKNVSGISKSTLDKKYSEAKNYLEQRHTP